MVPYTMKEMQIKMVWAGVTIDGICQDHLAKHGTQKGRERKQA